MKRKTGKCLVFIGKTERILRVMRCVISKVFHMAKPRSMENVENGMWKVKKRVENLPFIR